jgi:hypothetical protein
MYDMLCLVDKFYQVGGALASILLVLLYTIGLGPPNIKNVLIK